ncbi:MAG: protein-methionine-sulfoxide reductase heme-binding subunit MsrQ, partial [Candidatus Zixiibacteriota bacterium]
MPPRPSPQPWLKPGVFAGALVPLAVMIGLAATNMLGADPVALALNQFGYLALTFLAATLLCTPAKILLGWTWPIRLRRMLGLFAFFYAALHFLTYAVVDQSLNVGAVITDITKRNFILVGFLALVLMVPLALTSTNKMVRRLGFPRWKRLHRLTYIVGCLGAIHFYWRVKADIREPVVFAGVIGAALAIRLVEALYHR